MMKRINQFFFVSVATAATVGFLQLPNLAAAAGLDNPLGTVTDPNQLIGNVIRVLLGVVAAIAIVVIIYGGFMMLISAGNDQRVDAGRKALVWAFIGLLVIFGSYGIASALFAILSGRSLV